MNYVYLLHLLGFVQFRIVSGPFRFIIRSEIMNPSANSLRLQGSKTGRLRKLPTQDNTTYKTSKLSYIVHQE